MSSDKNDPKAKASNLLYISLLMIQKEYKKNETSSIERMLLGRIDTEQRRNIGKFAQINLIPRIVYLMFSFMIQSIFWTRINENEAKLKINNNRQAVKGESQ